MRVRRFLWVKGLDILIFPAEVGESQVLKSSGNLSVFCDLDGVTAADLLDPDIVLSATVGTVGDEASVRRPCRSGLQALV